MKLYGNILCLTYDELVPDIMKKGTYDSAKARESILVFGRGGNGREVLISYESLPNKYRMLVQAKYGNPYEYVAKEPITQLVQHDFEAVKFYQSYVIPNVGKLPQDYVEKYVIAASWLNMLRDLTKDKKRIKKELKLTLEQFWQTVCELIDKKEIGLPTNPKRLREKLAKYTSAANSFDAYATLVESWRFGNKAACRVKDEVAEALLLEMIAHYNQHDDTIIQTKYNEWASANGRQLILSDNTVGNYRRKYEWKLKAQREGNAAAYNKYGLHISRKRPSAPMLLIGSDDNDLDLFYIHEYYKDGRKQINYYKRPTLIVVMDAFNDYILGYSIASSQTHESVRAAYLSAMHHIKDLTGAFYLPHQVQTDRFGVDAKLTNELAMFYKSVGIYTPAKQGNARAKYIERAFGQEWHQQLKMFPNYAGTNITSKERINRDALELRKKDFPRVDQAHEQIELFINNLRSGKQQQWLDAFMSSEKSQQRRIDDELMLATFGTPHEYENRITNRGIVVTIGGAQYEYMVPEELYLQHVGTKVRITYDPMDMSRVLVTDGNTLRFVATQKELIPAALADYTPGDRAKLNELQERKRRDVERIAAEGARRKELLIAAGVDAQGILQAGVLDKGIKQAATQAFIGGGETDNTDINWTSLL